MQGKTQVETFSLKVVFELMLAMRTKFLPEKPAAEYSRLHQANPSPSLYGTAQVRTVLYSARQRIHEIFSGILQLSEDPISSQTFDKLLVSSLTVGRVLIAAL